MVSLKHVAAWAAMIAILVSPAPAFAAAKDAVMNKEGYWGIDVDKGACFATMTLQGGSEFLLRATEGRLTLGIFARSPIARSKTARIETEAYGVDFNPKYSKDARALYYDGDLDARAIAALRLAKQVRILTDGHPVASMTFEGTGFEGALDGVLACSRGEKGWWGPGVGAERAASGAAPSQKADTRGVLNKEGVWTVGADAEKCFASAPLKSGGEFILMADAGGLSFGVGLRNAPRQGRRGSFQTEAYAFDFQPSYTKDIVYLDDYFNRNALAALRLARDLRITVDGREVMQAHVEGTGLDGVLDAVLQCGRGQSGWWGQGAKVETASRAAPDRERKPPSGPSTGTGFFITANGVAVTAAHVVDGCRTVDSPRWGAAKVLAADKAADLAILKLASASGEFVSLRVRGPRLGEPMSAAGYPLGDLLGSGLKITTGVVSGLAGLEGDRGYFQVSAPIQPGNSGGPVIDSSGALIGVTAAKLDEVKVAEATGIFPQNINFAVPVTVLASFLDENAVAYKAAGAGAPGRGNAGAPPAVAMTGYTFELFCRP